MTEDKETLELLLEMERKARTTPIMRSEHQADMDDVDERLVKIEEFLRKKFLEEWENFEVQKE